MLKKTNVLQVRMSSDISELNLAFLSFPVSVSTAVILLLEYAMPLCFQISFQTQVVCRPMRHLLCLLSLLSRVATENVHGYSASTYLFFISKYPQ